MIDRRRLLQMVPVTLAMMAPRMADAASIAASTPEILSQMIAAGQSLVVDFKAEWCPTCHVQERVLRDIFDSTPELAAKVPVFVLDWDIYESHEFTLALKVVRRSTLVAFKGGQEVGRLIGATGREEILALLKTAAG